MARTADIAGELTRLYWRAAKRRALRRATGFWSGLDLIPRQAGLEARTGRDIDRFLSRGDGRRVPDFVIIGVPKSATSWLRAALQRHPGVATVQEEIEFFGANIEIGLDAYLARFAENAPALDRRYAESKLPYASLKLGEKSASMAATSAARIRLMQRMMPEARLVLMLRDPVERHWAHAKRYFSKKRFGKKRFAVESIAEAEYDAFFQATMRFGSYADILQRWWSVFGREALLVLWQEDAARDPKGVIAATFNHIGVTASDDLVEAAARRETRANRGPDMPMPPAIRTKLEAMFADEYRRLPEVLGDRTPSWWGTRTATAGPA